MREHVNEARGDCEAFGVNDRWRVTATQISNGSDSIALEPYVCSYRRTTSSVIDHAIADDDVKLLLRGCARILLRVGHERQRKD